MMPFSNSTARVRISFSSTSFPAACCRHRQTGQLATDSGFRFERCDFFGADYAETLRRWRARFECNLAAIEQGYDSSFMRLASLSGLLRGRFRRGPHQCRPPEAGRGNDAMIACISPAPADARTDTDAGGFRQLQSNAQRRQFHLVGSGVCTGGDFPSMMPRSMHFSRKLAWRSPTTEDSAGGSWQTDR